MTKKYRILALFMIVALFMTGMETEFVSAASKPAVSVSTDRVGTGEIVTLSVKNLKKGYRITVTSSDESVIKSPDYKTVDKTTAEIDLKARNTGNTRIKIKVQKLKKKKWKTLVSAKYDIAVYDGEYERAVSLGLVPESLQKDTNKTITFAEYAAMFDLVIEKAIPDRLKDWKTASKLFRNEKVNMTRNFGAQALFTAAVVTGADEIGYEASMSWIWEIAPENIDWWQGLEYSKKYFPDGEKKIYDNKAIIGSNWEFLNNETMITNAAFYALRFSYGSGRTLMDYDEQYQYNWRKALTRADAIHTALRFYESAICADFIPAKKATCEVTDETIALAGKMTAATYDHLPDWRGYNVTNAVDTFGKGDTGYAFSEADIKRVADQGMNFVRIPLTVQDIYKKEDGKEFVSRGCVKYLDELVNLCARYGIHVCFDVHNCPGFYTVRGGFGVTIFSDEEQQDLFCDFWKWMAKHYKNVPSSLLSFNLMNEPHISGGDLEDDVYSALMLKAISEIRSVSKDRLIIADMLAEGDPAWGLKDAKVAQSFHAYSLEPSDTEWPAVSTIKLVKRDTDHGLKLLGNFPAGSEISIEFKGAHRTSKLRWKAAGRTIDTYSIGGEKIGEDKCTEINEKGKEGEFRLYDGRIWTTVLKEATDSLELVQEGDGVWYWFTYISIKTPAYEKRIRGSLENDEITPVILIDDKGNITGSESGMVETTGVEYLKEKYKIIYDFSIETGEAVMAQEFGVDPAVPNTVTLAYEEDLLTVLDYYHIPWAHWDGNFGLWVSVSQDALGYVLERDDWKRREDGKFVDLGDGWYFDEGLAEVLNRH